MTAPLITRLEEAAEGSRELARSLTKVQRRYVADGCIHGDCSMQTTRALMQKGLFHLVIDSPNGQWGFLRLTDLGVAVQAILKANHKDKP